MNMLPLVERLQEILPEVHYVENIFWILLLIFLLLKILDDR